MWLMLFLFRSLPLFFFFFNDTATTEIYTLSLHDALPILGQHRAAGGVGVGQLEEAELLGGPQDHLLAEAGEVRSEEHTSELQSRLHLVCRLLLEKKKKNDYYLFRSAYSSNTHIPLSLPRT